MGKITHRLSILKTDPKKSFFDETVVKLEHEAEGNQNFFEITKVKTKTDYKSPEA